MLTPRRWHQGNVFRGSHADYLTSFDLSCICLSAEKDMEKSVDKLEILSLYLIPGLGSGAIRQLIGRFGKPERIYEATEAELCLVEGISTNVARRIKAREFLVDPEVEFQRIRKIGASLITFWDKEYPALLKEIKYPPVLLYCLGEAVWNHMPVVSIVGSRHPSHYGQRVARSLAYGLAKNGICVASGLAMGIDTCAHEGALNANGYTVAILGTGLDVVYPRTNKELFRKITQRGAILTEFPLGTPPDPKNFPIRNRIISGISKGVVVAEATRSSGSLITAAMAAEEGREVFAVPGSVESMKSTGCHYLIRQGAKLVEKVEDILEELKLPVSVGFGAAPDYEEQRELQEEEKVVLHALGKDPLHLDELSRILGMDAATLSALLISLELKGLVTQLPGKYYVR